MPLRIGFEAYSTQGPGIFLSRLQAALEQRGVFFKPDLTTTSDPNKAVETEQAAPTETDGPDIWIQLSFKPLPPHIAERQRLGLTKVIVRMDGCYCTRAHIIRTPVELDLPILDLPYSRKVNDKKNATIYQHLISADGVIFQSRFARALTEEFIFHRRGQLSPLPFKKPVSIIYNGIPLSVFVPEDDQDIPDEEIPADEITDTEIDEDAPDSEEYFEDEDFEEEAPDDDYQDDHPDDEPDDEPEDQAVTTSEIKKETGAVQTKPEHDDKADTKTDRLDAVQKVTDNPNTAKSALALTSATREQEQSDFQTDRVNVLISHSFQPYHRLHDALRIIAALNKTRKDGHFHLNIVGGDNASCFSYARQIAAKLKLQEGKDFSFLGKFAPEALPQVYQDNDFMLNLSYWDPCPNVVLEAMACGLPIVGVDHGGLAELVSDAYKLSDFASDVYEEDLPGGSNYRDGKAKQLSPSAGILVQENIPFEYIDHQNPDRMPKAPVQAYVDAIRELLAYLPDYCQNARLRAEQCFDIETVADQYIAFASEVAGHPLLSIAVG